MVALKKTAYSGQGECGVTEELADDQQDDWAAEWCKNRPRTSLCHPVLFLPRPSPGRGVVVSHTFSALSHLGMTSLGVLLRGRQLSVHS